MKSPKWVWGSACLLFAIVLSDSAISQTPPNGNQTTVIPNTATANFRATPGGELQNTSSNTTQVPAVVGQPELEVVKTADRAAAEPGDTVVYRLLIRNTGTAAVRNLVVRDTLPLGFQFQARTVRASLASGSNNAEVSLSSTSVSGDTVTFTYPSLAPGEVLTVLYAVTLTPDAIRGSGRNLAVSQGDAPGRRINSNTASYQLEIRAGILSDCGTIIGRVFVDKNFDGEQQSGEPGIPNAVIFLDDGNRITTDANGLFSLAYVISGYRTGTLDLTSLPGYTLAPNLYRIEGNSQSRLVKLAPGGLARMNFAVTPAFQEEGQ
jgi:uncharacterized repeat protein (TIGR01451 family)